MKLLRHVFPSLILGLCILAAAAVPAARAASTGGAYSETEILDAAGRFFEGPTEGLADAVRRAFKEYGSPNAYIEGGEGGGSFVVGVRYGEGDLVMKSGARRHVFWQGPSLGLDWGANLSKTFTLVYNLRDPKDIYQRFPGVEGSAYLIGGVSLTYYRAEGVSIAPIRTGAGLRLGANVGYVHFTREKEYNPF